MQNKLLNDFKEIFNEEGELYFSPGRVNLIGEHIDYNGGFVMPLALSYGTYGVATKRSDNKVRLFSSGYSQEVYEFDLENFSKDNTWTDYVKGVFDVLNKRGIKVTSGLNLFIYSNLPTGAGLSSSSSLELLVTYILNDLYDLNINRVDMAIIGKEVENNYIGVNSGIMDQFAISLSKENHAMILNTENLEHEFVPINLGEYQLFVANTNKKRGLADSKYNERFSECRKSLEILKDTYQINDLCELKVSELSNIEKLLNNDILYKRVKHVISEQERTINTAEALKTNDLDTFALNLIASHNSLRDDYDVTGIELDTLVELSLKHGAKGARMTGAGFGGCIVGLVRKDKIESLTEAVISEYNNLIGYEPTFYPVNASDGTKKL